MSARPEAPPAREVSIGISADSANAIVQYVGVDHGIYEHYGFRVQLQQIRSNIAPAALTGNQLDYHTSVDAALRLAAAGMAIKVVASHKRAPTFAIVAVPEIVTVQDLRGKVLGTTSAAGSSYYALKRGLEAHGMAARDVQILVLGNAPVVLQNLLVGTTDAGVLSAPHVFEALEKGYRMLAYLPDHVNFASSGLTVSDEAIAVRREEIKRMIAAQIEAIRFIQANRDQAVDSLVRRFDIPRELGIKTYEFEVPAYTTDPRIPLDDLEATLREEIELGHVTEPVPMDRMVAQDLAEEVLKGVWHDPAAQQR